ncbi:aspartate aminotransferase family protein [candidate division KSB1 bacterium]|nr:aspartate aminotransferase family protein [candidate division KSB1 bacterium]
MNSKKIIETEKQVHLQTYLRSEIVFTHGKGVYLYDSDGKRYLDFIAGIAVNAFGHCDEQLQQVLKAQAAKLWHCSNLYYSEPQVRLAKILVDNSFADKVFFCNSGAEAIEGTIKIARKWATATKGENSFEIIAFNRSFHGRTMGALSATGQAKFWEGFKPMLSGFQYANFNDLESVKNLITEKACAVMVEPVQGEGGVYPAEIEFLQGLRELCNSKNCLLILDEIQCGLGRTGNLFAYEHYGILPDMVALAKPIAAGLPMGAILLTDAVADPMKYGDHGSTFGGGPLVASIAEHSVSRVLEKSFLQEIKKNGHYLLAQLKNLRSRFNEIIAIRGIGLMIGMDVSVDVKKIIHACMETELVVAKAGDNTIRLTPPLIIEKAHIDEAVEKLIKAFEKVRKENGQKSEN